jgi:lipopolysaccharide biosynthesis protein
MLHHWRGIARHANVLGANYRPMRELLRRMDLSIKPDDSIEFPSGSMFWFRSSALAPLFALNLDWLDFYGCKARNVDATIAHAIERSILIFAAKAGFKWAFLPKRWARRSWVR